MTRSTTTVAREGANLSLRSAGVTSTDPGGPRWLLVRFAWEDRYPAGTDSDALRDAARDSVIRCAQYFGLQFRFEHDQKGMRWVYGPDGLEQTWISGWRCEAVVHGPMPVELLESGAAKWLRPDGRGSQCGW